MWDESSTDIDGNQAAAIAQAMRQVAMADGESHERELALINGFERLVPADADGGKASFGDLASRAIYLKSLVMVGLADGALSDTEVKVIRACAVDVGASGDEIEAAINEVKMEFLAHFQGVKHFADQVSSIARELDLPAA